MKYSAAAYLILGLFLVIISFGACKKDNPGREDDFDRAAMLENYAANLIRPAYQSLLTEILLLENDWTAFTAEATEARLQVVQQQWLQTALAWQSANGFNFGPAGEQGLRKGLIEEIGTFPVNVDKIEGFIAAGDVSLNNFDRDSRGILAVEYLLFGPNGDIQEALLSLQTENRRAYLAAILRHLYLAVETVVNAWADYQTEFITNDGTDVGSATSQFYNEFVRSYEAAKNFKVGLPAGKRAGQTQSEPRLVEAYYSGRSLDLLKAHLAAVDRIYHGANAAGTNGLGLDDYLRSVAGGPALLTTTESQWQEVLKALNAVPDNVAFSQLMAQDDINVDDLHTEMQKQIRFFKSDLSSLLGIAITFNSGDGD